MYLDPFSSYAQSFAAPSIIIILIFGLLSLWNTLPVILKLLTSYESCNKVHILQEFSVSSLWRSLFQSPLIWTGCAVDLWTHLGFFSHSSPFVGTSVSWTLLLKFSCWYRGDKIWDFLYSESIFYSNVIYSNILIPKFWLGSNFKVGNMFFRILKVLILCLFFPPSGNVDMWCCCDSLFFQ